MTHKLDVRDRVVALYLAGKSIPEIITIAGMSRNRIFYWIGMAGVAGSHNVMRLRASVARHERLLHEQKQKLETLLEAQRRNGGHSYMSRPIDMRGGKRRRTAI